jgi:uncharacterized membrane protein YbhN (UPF0104 family)
MSDPLLHPEDEGVRKPRPLWRYGTEVLSLALLIGAIYFAVSRADWHAVRQANPADFVGLIALTVGAVLASAVMFFILFKPFEATRPITLWEWIKLIFATSLLNYAMRAGLMGRLAYMKKRHGVSYAASGLLMLLIGGGTTGLYVLLGLLTFWRGGFDVLWVAGLIVGLIFGTFCTWPLAIFAIRKFGVNPTRGVPMWIFVAYLTRVADTFCFAGRYYLAAKIFGHPIEFPFALVLGSACNFAQLATPLNVGLKEWVGGKLLEYSGGGISLDAGVAIGVVDRAAEVVVYVLAGSVSLFLLHRKLSRHSGV